VPAHTREPRSPLKSDGFLRFFGDRPVS
jgi:hypothetical protein